MNIKKANVHASHEGKTLLHACIGNDSIVNGLEIPKLLVDYGVNINDASKIRNWTPLHTSVECNDYHMAKMLLENHANTEVVTDKLWTPLHWAACFGRIRIIKLLLDNGANKYALNNSNETPLDCYKRMKKVFTFPLFKWMFKWLHPDLGVKLGQYMSVKNKMISGDEDAKYLGEEIMEYTSYIEKDWSQDKNTSCNTIKSIYMSPAYGNPIFADFYMNGKLLFSGAETSPLHGGYMDGAIYSGKLAAEKLKH